MILQIVYLAIAIVVLTLALAFVCIRGAQMERKIKILEAEIDFLKLNEEIYNEHINSIYAYLISVCDRLKNTNDYESDK